MRELRDSKRQLETILAFLLPISGIFKNLLLFKAFFPSIMKHQGILLIHIKTKTTHKPKMDFFIFLGEKCSHVMRHH